MTTELAIVETPQTELVDPRSLGLSGMPQKVLEEAITAAKALKDVISKQEKPVIFNGKQYLTFEDWQTIARFYGITTKVVEAKYVKLDEDLVGFEAKACAYHVGSEQEISCAEALCLNNERNWRNKELFQLKSMAQTRACAKALRNVLSWVVKLAGYEPTPAEEMTGEENKNSKPEPQRQSQPSNTSNPYWTSTFNGKKFLFARVSNVLDEESLTHLGMNPTPKNPKIFIADYSEKIEEGLKVRLQFGGSDA